MIVLYGLLVQTRKNTLKENLDHISVSQFVWMIQFWHAWESKLLPYYEVTKVQKPSVFINRAINRKGRKKRINKKLSYCFPTSLEWIKVSIAYSKRAEVKVGFSKLATSNLASPKHLQYSTTWRCCNVLPVFVFIATDSKKCVTRDERHLIN